jgi:hypothetical protein
MRGGYVGFLPGDRLSGEQCLQMKMSTTDEHYECKEGKKEVKNE